MRRRTNASRRRRFGARLHALREREPLLPPDHLPMQVLELSDGAVMRIHSDGAPETLAALRELGEAAVARMREGGAP